MRLKLERDKEISVIYYFTLLKITAAEVHRFISETYSESVPLVIKHMNTVFGDSKVVVLI